MDAFEFEEEITFSHDGAPMLHYHQRGWSPGTDELIHTETGIWRPRPEGRIEVSIALPSVTEIAEGTIDGYTIHLESTTCARARMGAGLTKTRRTYEVSNGTLTWTADMATEETPLTHHISGTLTRL